MALKKQAAKKAKKNNFISLRTETYAILTIALVSFYIFQSATEPGHIVFGDIDFGFFVNGYLDRMLGAWNEQWSNPNFFNLSRLPIIAPLYLFFTTLNIAPELFLKTVVFGLLIASGYGMFRLIRKILQITFLEERDHKLNTDDLFLIALISALLYAFNPWSITRVQHLYLLTGYATLPYVFYYVVLLTETQMPNRSEQWKLSILNPFYKYKEWIDKNSLRAVLISAFLWILGSAAVHYLFFTFFLVAFWGIYAGTRYLVDLRASALRALFSRYVLLGLFVGGLCAYFIMPQLLSSPIQSISPNNINTIDSVDMLSRNSQILYVLYLVSYWWSMFDLSLLTAPFWIAGGFLLTLIWGGCLLSLNNIFTRFFVPWCVVMALLATGTKGPLTLALLWIIFDSPIASTMGFLFRDPNKFIALLVFGYAILLGVNLAYITDSLKRLQDEKAKEFWIIKQLLKHKTLINPYRILIFILGIAIPLSYLAYIEPYRVHFVQQYYKTVEVPDYYLSTNHWLKQNSEGFKTIWLPRNEMITSPGEDVVVTKWNEGRATSSIDIFSTQAKTYNTTEGSTPYMSNWYEFIYQKLKENRGSNLMSHLEVLNIKNLIYHNDVVGLEEEGQATVNALKSQPALETFGKIGDNHFFKNQDPVSSIHLFPQALVSSRGLNVINLLSYIPGFNFKNYALWFANTESQQNPYAETEEGDIVHYQFFDDVINKYVSDEFYLFPFDHVNNSNAFVRWAKNRVTSPDWKWHLDHLEIKNWPWDFDLNKGFIFTYAPEMVDLPPYKDLFESGKEFINDDTLKDLKESFFASEDERALEVEFAPNKGYAKTPFIKGEMTKGGLEFWKVATSRFMDVGPETGYTFAFTISGRNTKKIHGKIKYYNEFDEEVGVSYVSAPQQVDTFNFVRFKGSFVTPPEATKIKIQLWTYRQPREKTYWWVHNLEIKTLEHLMKPNEIVIPRYIKEAGEYRVMARVFHSQKGGPMDLTVGPYRLSVNTKTPGINQFFWEDLGTLNFENGTLDIRIENKEGFNAVNALMIVPLEEYETAKANAVNMLKKTKSLYLMEPREEGISDGSMQHDFYNSKLSNGYATFIDEGLVNLSADIQEAGDYQLFINSLSPEAENNTNLIEVYVLNEKKNVLFKKSILDFVKKTKQADWVNVDSFYLLPGKHFFKFVFKSGAENLFPTRSIKKFLPGEDWVERQDFLLEALGEKKTESNCCTCEGLGLDYLDINHDEKEGATKLSIVPGCSCWWVVASSAMAPVSTKNVYNLKFDIQTRYANLPHIKLIYLDKNKVFLDYEHIQTLESNEKNWVTYEKIIKPPKYAAYAQFHIWTRKNPYTNSEIWVRDLKFKDYEELANIDSALLIESKDNSKDLASFFTPTEAQENSIKSVTYANQDDYPLKLTLPETDKRLILQLSESFSKLWQISDYKGNSILPLSQSSVLNSYSVPANFSRDIKIQYVSERFLYYGLALSGVTLSILVLLFGLSFSKKNQFPRGRRVLMLVHKFISK